MADQRYGFVVTAGPTHQPVKGEVLADYVETKVYLDVDKARALVSEATMTRFRGEWFEESPIAAARAGDHVVQAWVSPHTTIWLERLELVD